MSHITRVKTEIKDAVALMAALKKLGYQVMPERNRRSNAFLSDESLPQFKAVKTGRSLAFKSGQGRVGAYEIAADWEESPSAGDGVLAEILRAYAIEKVVRAGKMRGYTVARQEAKRSGEIEIVLRRAV